MSVRAILPGEAIPPGVVVTDSDRNLSILTIPVTGALVRPESMLCAELACETVLTPGDPVWWSQLDRPYPQWVDEDTGFYIYRRATGGPLPCMRPEPG